MRTFVIIFAVYFVPAVALLTFAWAMEKRPGPLARRLSTLL